MNTDEGDTDGAFGSGECGDPFAWQRNHYERTIRNRRELCAVRRYIHDNPAHWAKDRENPDRQDR